MARAPRGATGAHRDRGLGEVRERARVLRLVQPRPAGAGNLEGPVAPEALVFDRAGESRALRLEVSRSLLEVVAHEPELLFPTRVFRPLDGVDPELRRREREDQPP